MAGASDRHAAAARERAAYERKCGQRGQHGEEGLARFISCARSSLKRAACSGFVKREETEPAREATKDKGGGGKGGRAPSLNDKVEAKFKAYAGGKGWFPGTITKEHENEFLSRNPIEEFLSRNS